MTHALRTLAIGKTATLSIAASLVLTACGGMGTTLWPFGDSAANGTARGYENAREYRCEGGKSFHVRLLDEGKAAWLMWPERKVRLEKGTAAGQYSNGIAVLTLDGDKAALNDGPSVSLKACSAAQKTAG